MTPHRRLLLCATGVAALTCGCKSFGGGGKDKTDPAAERERAGDPLLGGRIPARGDVPTKDPVADGGRDPILSTPAGRFGKRPDPKDLPARIANDPGREPWRPDRNVSPAALAGGVVAPDAELNLERDPGKTSANGARFDQAAAKLTAAGATVRTPTKTAAGYAVVATVPIDGDPPGTRSYTGAGPTPAAAAEDALAQVTAARK